MKNNIRHIILIQILFALVIFKTGLAEGTKQLVPIAKRPDAAGKLYLSHNNNTAVQNSYSTFGQLNADADYRIMFTVNALTEVVYMGFNSSDVNTSNQSQYKYYIRQPNNVLLGPYNFPISGNNGFINNYTQADAGPNTINASGYIPITIVPTMTGDYSVEFTFPEPSPNNGTFTISYYDITVAAPSGTTHIAIPGRVWSRSWQVNVDFNDESFYGSFYIYSDEGIVTKFTADSMKTGTFSIFSNETGCSTTGTWEQRRKSVSYRVDALPQYKIFLNEPDAIYPIGTLGQVISATQQLPASCDGSVVFMVVVDKPGKVTLNLDCPPLNINNGEDVTITSDVQANINNLITWNGDDNFGNQVSSGTNIIVDIDFLNSLTNLPLYDVEGNNKGFKVDIVYPYPNPLPPEGTKLRVYWDDTNLSMWGGYNNSSTGCLYPASLPTINGCHNWTFASSNNGQNANLGNFHTVNSWWYYLSQGTVQMSVIINRAPGMPAVPAGPSPVCQGQSVTYTVPVVPSATSYLWTLPNGTTQTTTTNQLTITFTAPSTGNLSVHGINVQCGAGPESIALSVEVLESSTPTLTGNNNLCSGSTGNMYTTEPGKTNYIWTVSSGGTITAGGTSTSNTVTVNWSGSGANTVSVTYQGPPPGNCSTGTPTVYNVTVNPLPVPVISGPVTPCVNSTGNVYSTSPGMSGYIWTVSLGGVITSGFGSSTITVTWNTTGSKTVLVTYTDSHGCSPTTPTVFPLTVNAVSTPTLSGPSSVCQNSSGNVYTTESGNTNYIWNVSAGGIITSGGSSSNNTVTITWSTSGFKSVSVNYTNSNLCAAGAPTVYNVNVNAVPVPTIIGPSSACVNAIGNVYTTQAGQTNYVWNVSAGGTITFGGTSTSNTVIVTWNTTGAKTVSVNYTNSGLCTASNPTVYNVTVNPVPTPTISGPSSVCANSTGNVYNTQSGNSNYIWSVSAGGTVTSGGTSGSNTVTVTWNTAGAKTVSVNYTNATNCAAAAPTVFAVTVNSQASPAINGPVVVCATASNNVYTTESGNTNYIWNISSGGIITAGGSTTSNTVTVTWNTTGSQSVSVNYTNASLCSAGTPTALNVMVNPLPTPTITGNSTLCQNTVNTIYSTQSGNSNYFWTVSPGGTITSGGSSTSSTIGVTWNTAGPQSISVNYTNSASCPANAPSVYTIQVNPVPVPVVTGPDYVCNNTINNSYLTEAGNNTYSWNISSGGNLTSGGSLADNTAILTWVSPGNQTVSVNYLNSFNCTAASPYVLNVVVSPEPVVSAGNSSTICSSGTLQLNGSQQYCESVKWTSSGNGSYTNVTLLNPVYTPGSADITAGSVVLTLTGRGSAACSGKTDIKTITLNIDPMPTVNAGSDGTYCVQNPIFVGGAIATNYTELLWTAGDGILETNTIPEPTYMPGSIDFNAGTVTLTLRVKGDLTCSNQYVTDSRIFSVTPYPTINAGPDDFICSSQTQFQLAGSGTSYATNNIRWTFIGGDGILNDATLLQPVYFPGPIDLSIIDRSVLFNLNLHGYGNCIDVSLNDQVEWKIDPRPVSNAGVDDGTCGQRPYQLSATALYHNTINWQTNGGGSFSNSTILNPTYTPGPGDVDHIVVLTLDLSGCKNLTGDDIMLLTVHPDPSATISGSTTECEATPVPLSISLTGTPPWNITYTNGITPVSVTGILNSPYSFSVTPGLSTAYRVIAADDIFCSAPADSLHGLAFVAINPLPDPFLVTGSNNGFYCEGDTGISVGLNNSQLGMMYELFRNGITTGIVLNGTGNPLQFGIFPELGQYSILGTNPVGDCRIMMSDTITVVMNPTPVTDFSSSTACSGDTTFFTVSGDFIQQISTWFWDYGDGTYATFNAPQNPVHVFPTHGTFNVFLSVVDTNGCKYSVSHPVIVRPHPVAFFSASIPNCKGSITQFTDLSTNPQGQGYIRQWTWDFGDGSQSVTILFPNNPNITHTYSLEGEYTVTLSIDNSVECSDSWSTTIAVQRPPVAGFTSWNNCEDMAAVFQDNSNENFGGQITSWLWNFGEPTSGSLNTSFLQNPTHTYSTAGNFNVTLIVTNLNGCSDTLQKTITVKAAPLANFFNTPGCLNSATLFLADSTLININATATYAWDFGDGATAFTRNTTHNYLAPGTFTVTLTITDTAGCEGFISLPVTVNPPPVTHFTANTDNCQGQAVAFANQSTSGTGFINKWVWNFGDGNTQTILFPSNPNVSHTYIGAGTFSVSLTVTNNEGCTHSESRLVNMLGAPTSDFMMNGQCVGTSVQFTDLTTVSGTQVLSNWNWNFGDPTSGTSNTSTLKNPTHDFATAGTYVVKLITFTGNGCSDTITRNITIKSKPVVDFNTQSACANNLASFTPTGMTVGAIASWSWTFGDGGSSNLQAPTHTYTSPGTYSVTLTVTDTAGCSNTRTKPIIISPVPDANFGYTTPTCQGNIVLYTDMSSTTSGFIARYHWDFGDGNTQNINFPASPDVTHQYANAGTFNVVLTVKTNDSCTNQLTRVVTILSKPTAAFAHGAACQGNAVMFNDQSISNTTGTISGWNWNFGDPASGTANNSGLQNPNHSYNLAGNYTVALIISIPGGCSDTITHQITVSPPPTVDFTPVAGCNGDTTQFTSTVNAVTTQGFYWQFGDGGTSFIANPVHIYANSGTYTVTLTITDTAGCTNVKVKPVTVIQGPSAAFSSSSLSCSGLPITFTDLSNANGGTISSWYWDFGDGTDTTFTSATSSFAHTYAQSGTFLVKLNVFSSAGCENLKQQIVTISPSPLAAFDYQNNCQGQSTQFTDLTNLNGGSSLTHRAWNFGDPTSGILNTSTQTNPVHTYSLPGTYNVTLITLNGGGCVDTIQQNVSITPKPGVDFYNDSLVCFGNTITLFTDTAIANIAALSYFEWDFGDGSPHAFTQNASHQYNVAGTFTVTLTVQDTAGCDNFISRPLIIHAKPNPQFTYLGSCENTNTQFTDQSIAPQGDTIVSWLWEFIKGTTILGTDTVQNPDFIFNQPGTFSVKLTTFTEHGCNDTKILPVQIWNKPTAYFKYTASPCANGLVTFQDSSWSYQGLVNSWAWEFEPYQYGTGTNPNHQYYAVDSCYAVTLMIKDLRGCMDTVVQQICVPPVLLVDFNTELTCFGSPVTFTPELVTPAAPADSLITFNWNFGDPATGSNNVSTKKSPAHSFSSVGFYTVSFTTTDKFGCPASKYKTLQVNALPVASFSYTTGQCDSTLIFNSTSIDTSSTINTYIWQYGDGTSDTLTTPLSTHKYDVPGEYLASITIINDNGCTDTFTDMVTCSACIVAATIAAESLLCQNYDLSFADISTCDGTITQWNWNFGDGTPALNYGTYQPSVIHTFLNPGPYTISLKVSTQVGTSAISDSTTLQILVKPTPLAGFSVNPVCLGVKAEFNDTTISSGASSLYFLWEFDDEGRNDTSSLSNPSYLYSNPGLYKPVLIVKNQYGCADTTITDLMVNALPDAAYANSLACVGQKTYFFDASQSYIASLADWGWHVTDSITSIGNMTGDAPSYVFDSTGIYMVMLTVSDSNGCSDTIIQKIEVNPSPLSAFSYTDNVDNIQGQVQFTNGSIGATEYYWNFGNGDVSYDPSPQITYSDDGTYNVILVSVSEQGCHDTALISYDMMFKGLYVPNALAPGGPIQSTRFWKPVGVNLATYLAEVYNSDGTLLWFSKLLDVKGAPVEVWDGTYNEKLCQQDVYVWKITAIYRDGSIWYNTDVGERKGLSEPVWGTITLIR